MSKKALLVSVDYTDAKLQLPGGVKNLEMMNAIMESVEAEVRALRASRDTTANGIATAFTQLVANCNANDSRLFYFHGHGKHLAVSHLW